MTPKQTAYVRHRAAGLGQTRAAIAAGYAKSSARVIACRMEKLPAIRKAIAEARKAARTGSADAATPEFSDAESYLAGVVRGLAPADPVRVSAARTLIQYQRKRERAPLPSVAPKTMEQRDVRDRERELLDQWAATAQRVRARLRERTGT